MRPSDEDGFHGVQLPDIDGPVPRGRVQTGAEGRLRFWTILPTGYPIPDDGQTGRMLATTTSETKDDLVVDLAPGQGPPSAGRTVKGGWRLLEFTFPIVRERPG